MKVNSVLELLYQRQVVDGDMSEERFKELYATECYEEERRRRAERIEEKHMRRKWGM